MSHLKDRYKKLPRNVFGHSEQGDYYADTKDYNNVVTGWDIYNRHHSNVKHSDTSKKKK